MHILDLVPARYNGFYNFLLLLLSLHPKKLSLLLILRLIETLKLVFIHSSTI